MSIKDGSEGLHLADVKDNKDNECKLSDIKESPFIWRKSDNDASGIDKVINHICRHYNWVIVLMLTPISLGYDLYSFRKYINLNLIYKQSYLQIVNIFRFS